MLQAVPDALILVLSGENVERSAARTLQHGKSEHSEQDAFDAHWLPHVLHYAIAHKAQRGKLPTSEADFHAMSEASPLGIFVSDTVGNCTYTNAAYQEISGLTLAQTLGTNWTTAVFPDDRPRVLAEWRAAAMGDEPFQTEYRFLRKDKSVVWTRVSSAPMLDGMKMNGRVKTVEDISERKISEFALRTAEDALFEEKERAQVTLNSIGDAVLTTDLSGNVTYLNVVAETMTGWPWNDALGRPLLDVFRIINGVTREMAGSPAQRAIDEDKTVGLAMDSVLIRRDGSEAAIEDSAAPIHDRDGHTAGAVIVFHDVSESRFMALKMAHLAQHDFLTGLPNRVLLTERLSQAIGLAHRHHKQVGILFVDLDSFKHVNDSLGHAVGDQLLQSVAERLTAGVRTTDTICRQGGDEFVILLAEIEQPQDAANVAEKLLVAFAEPHHIGSNDLHVTLSIGISVYPDDSSDADSLMQNADTCEGIAGARMNFRAGIEGKGVRQVKWEWERTRKSF